MTTRSEKKYTLPTILLTLFAAILLICLNAAYFSAHRAMATARESEGVEVSYTTRSDALLQQAYLDWYGVSVNADKEFHISSYSVNGGNYGSNVPANAFDGNFDTFWETNTVNSDTFKNQISVEFNRAATIDRILFATRRDGQWQKGFPLTATFYVSEDGEGYERIAAGVAEVKNNVVLYTFSQPFTAKYFRFEYTDVYSGMTQHASASELIFLQPEEEIVQKVRDMFSDYMHTRLRPEFNEEETIRSLQKELENHPLYAGDLENYLNRALSVLDGTLLTDPINRQFTTDPLGRGVFLQQRGNIFDYGQKLHFMFGLSNYMPTGIFGNTGERITVYVDADEGQPLPKIVFTQFLTTYKYWQGGQIQLQRGVNVLTVPSFTYTESYTNAGGPVYLVNPYTAQEQNTSVKVYIEGGHTYPVFYKGGSEEKFKNDILDYTEYYRDNADTAFNIVEVMSDHMLVTAQATRAEDIYIGQGVSAQKVCENWDEYMRALLSFNGVTFDKDNPYYDARVEKLYLNVRVMQPFSSAADAYATGQHVGIRINTGWETTALQGSGFGWGTSHEIGHIIEIGEYRVLEYTNNMVSNFNETVLDGLPSRGNHSKITNLLAPDSILGSDGIASGGSYDNTYVVWWNIESVFPGYWGRYNNLFRYGVPQGYPTADGMSAVEKQVYYSSIATGLDTGYYFDRYGYRFNNVQFKLESVSEAYRQAVAQLTAAGKLSEKQLKFWYVGADTATLNYKNGDKLAIYSEKSAVSPLSVLAENGGHRFNLPDRSAQAGHLGYEIIENGKVIGFTTTATYFDGTAYQEGYVPRYQIRAYDQKLNATAASDVWKFDKTAAAARIGNREFPSLAAALAAAAENDTIVLLADIAEEGLTVGKSVTITSGGKPVYLLKIGENNMLNVAAGATLTLAGSAAAPIIVDGSSVQRGGLAVSASGGLVLKYVNFQNLNGTTADGTAICLTGESASLSAENCSFTNITGSGRGNAIFADEKVTGTISIAQCEFRNNRTTGAVNGGAVFLNAPATITNSAFIGNRAETNSGGALLIGGKNSVVRGCEFRNNYADAWDQKGGGAVFVRAFCAFEDCLFEGNSAFTGSNGGQGGAVLLESGADFLSCTFTGNKAFASGACHISSGKVHFQDCTITDNASSSTGAAIGIGWAESVDVSFDGCTVTGNQSTNAGTIWINYYTYPSRPSQGLGQTKLSFTNSVLRDNTNGGANIFVVYSWLRLDATGSTIIGSVNKKTELLECGYENLYITLLQDAGTDGEILRRADQPLGEDVFEHFTLGPALANKYYLEQGETGNSLWLRQLRFNVSVDSGGDISTDGKDYVYGDTFLAPEGPQPPYGYRFLGWEYGGKTYQPGEEISLVDGGKITASFEQYLFDIRLVYNSDESVSAGYFEKGDILDLSVFSVPAGGKFIGWLYKGAVYLPEDKVVFDGRNDTFVALYEQPQQPDDQPQQPDNPGNENPPPDNTGDPEGKNYTTLIVIIAVVIVAAVGACVAVSLILRKRRNKN